MKHFLVLPLLLASVVLAGCATPSAPELRPFTAQESKELAMEALSRRGLSFDEYQQKKAELTGQVPKGFATEHLGDMSAEREVLVPGREG